MNTKSRTRYLYAEFNRIVKGKRFYLAIAGVTAALFFALEGSIDFNSSVLYVFTSATYKAGFVAVFIFCACPSATCFSEDLEANYIRYVIIRGTLKRYVLSKVIAIFLSSIFIMTAGCTLFALICRVWLPWQDADSVHNIVSSGSFRIFLEYDTKWLWFAAYGVQRGILAGILALMSSYISLYITNRMIVFAAPAFIYQLILELGFGFFNDLGIFHPVLVFDAQYNIFYHDSLSFLWAVALGIIFAILIGFAIYKKVGKRI